MHTYQMSNFFKNVLGNNFKSFETYHNSLEIFTIPLKRATNLSS